MKKKVEGCWPVRTLVRACLLLGLLPAVCPAAAENLRSPRDARAWSVLLQADETLRWRWHAEAAAAALVVADETGAPVSASDLPTVGGWGVLDPRAAFARRYGAFDVSVVFDGEAALSARLVRPNLGTLLFIR